MNLSTFMLSLSYKSDKYNPYFIAPIQTGIINSELSRTLYFISIWKHEKYSVSNRRTTMHMTN
jgi:hypothetical protein